MPHKEKYFDFIEGKIGVYMQEYTDKTPQELAQEWEYLFRTFCGPFFDIYREDCQRMVAAERLLDSKGWERYYDPSYMTPQRFSVALGVWREKPPQDPVQPGKKRRAN